MENDEVSRRGNQESDEVEEGQQGLDGREDVSEIGSAFV